MRPWRTHPYVARRHELSPRADERAAAVGRMRPWRTHPYVARRGESSPRADERAVAGRGGAGGGAGRAAPPQLQFHGGAGRRFAAIGGRSSLLTITHSDDLALAQVMILG